MNTAIQESAMDELAEFAVTHASELSALDRRGEVPPLEVSRLPAPVGIGAGHMSLWEIVTGQKHTETRRGA